MIVDGLRHLWGQIFSPLACQIDSRGQINHAGACIRGKNCVFWHQMSRGMGKRGDPNAMYGVGFTFWSLTFLFREVLSCFFSFVLFSAVRRRRTKANWASELKLVNSFFLPRYDGVIMRGYSRPEIRANFEISATSSFPNWPRLLRVESAVRGFFGTV